MHKYIIIYLLIFGACQQTSAPLEVPEDKVAKIIADLSIAEGSVTMLSGYKRDSLAHAYYKQVYEMNGITLEEYEKYLRILVIDTDRLESVLKKSEQLTNSPTPRSSLVQRTSVSENFHCANASSYFYFLC